MNRLTRVLVGVSFIAAFALSRGAPPAAAQDLSVVSFTGELEITVEGQKITVVAGATAPKIPPGAKVRVVSGTAVLAGDKVSVKVDAGAKFQYNASIEEGVVKVNIAAEAGSTDIQAEISGNIVTIEAGEAVNVSAPETGPAVIEASAGEVTVQTADGETQTVSEGETASVPAGEAPPTYAEAPSEEAPQEPEAPPPAPNTVNQEVDFCQANPDAEGCTVVSPSAP